MIIDQIYEFDTIEGEEEFGITFHHFKIFVENGTTFLSETYTLGVIVGMDIISEGELAQEMDLAHSKTDHSRFMIPWWSGSISSVASA